MRYLVCYDTPDTKRRNRLAKRLEAFGFRVQFSVFECDLTPALRRELSRTIAGSIDPETDNVRIYPLCDSCGKRIEVAGIPDAFQFAQSSLHFE